MLYITTREKYDASTTAKSLGSDCGADGGLYVPFQMPCFDQNGLEELVQLSFGPCVARILNVFFSRGLTGWDVEFSIGRHPVKVRDIRSNILVAELWHNENNSYKKLESSLAEKLLRPDVKEQRTSWLRIAIRISVLFGIYGQMRRTGEWNKDALFDVAVPAGDFSCAMAVWYARQMGLPVANIVCGCNKNGAVWELLHLGQVRTDLPVIKTSTPKCDVALPAEIERLICGTLGQSEARCFADVCGQGDIYAPEAGMLETFRKGMFAAVVSDERLEGLIPNVYSTTGYLMGPYTGLAYGGLLDYRTRYRDNRPALLLADRSPICDCEYTAAAMNLPASKLKELF